MKTTLKVMMRYSWLLSFVVASAIVTGCVSKPSLNDQILGTWAGEMRGFEVTMVYGKSDISIEGFGMDLPYRLDGSQIYIDLPELGVMTMEVIIEGNTMTQTEIHSGETTVFTRLMQN